jgi:hypothetical protein
MRGTSEPFDGERQLVGLHQCKTFRSRDDPGWSRRHLTIRAAAHRGARLWPRCRRLRGAARKYNWRYNETGPTTFDCSYTYTDSRRKGIRTLGNLCSYKHYKQLYFACFAIGLNPNLRDRIGFARKHSRQLQSRIRINDQCSLRHGNHCINRHLQFCGTIEFVKERRSAAALCHPCRQCAMRGDLGRAHERRRFDGRFAFLHAVLKAIVSETF